MGCNQSSEPRPLDSPARRSPASSPAASRRGSGASLQAAAPEPGHVVVLLEDLQQLRRAFDRAAVRWVPGTDALAGRPGLVTEVDTDGTALVSYGEHSNPPLQWLPSCALRVTAGSPVYPVGPLWMAQQAKTYLPARLLYGGGGKNVALRDGVVLAVKEAVADTLRLMSEHSDLDGSLHKSMRLVVVSAAPDSSSRGQPAMLLEYLRDFGTLPGSSAAFVGIGQKRDAQRALQRMAEAVGCGRGQCLHLQDGSDLADTVCGLARPPWQAAVQSREQAAVLESLNRALVMMVVDQSAAMKVGQRQSVIKGLKRALEWFGQNDRLLVVGFDSAPRLLTSGS